MIKALSPYWIEIPFVSPNTSLTCTDFTLQVFVWNGDKGSPPTTPSYQQTIKNPTASTGVSRINIANLVSDFIDFTQQDGTTTELLNGNNQNWVKWQTFYTTTEPSDATTPTNQNVKLMLRGYSYGMDGENQSTPSNKILLSGNEFKVSRSSVFVLPIEIDEAVPALGTLNLTSMSQLDPRNWTVNWLGTGSLDNVFFRWKPDVETDWFIGEASSPVSPFNAYFIAYEGAHNVQLFAYDNANAITVYSNILNINVVVI